MKRSEAQNKVWYRVLKVLFTVTLIVAIGFLSIIVAEDAHWRELNPSSTKITCAENWKSKDDEITFTAEDVSMYVYDSLFEGGAFKYEDYFRDSTNGYSFNSGALSKIFKRCFLMEENPTAATTIYGQYLFELVSTEGMDEESALEAANKTMAQQTNAERLEELNFSFQVFDVEPGYKYLGFIWSTTLWLAIILLVWETVRRVFYYILFGAFLFEDYNPVVHWIKSHLKGN